MTRIVKIKFRGDFFVAIDSILLLFRHDGVCGEGGGNADQCANKEYCHQIKVYNYNKKT